MGNQTTKVLINKVSYLIWGTKATSVSIQVHDSAYQRSKARKVLEIRNILHLEVHLSPHLQDLLFALVNHVGRVYRVKRCASEPLHCLLQFPFSLFRLRQRGAIFGGLIHNLLD